MDESRLLGLCMLQIRANCEDIGTPNHVELQINIAVASDVKVFISPVIMKRNHAWRCASSSPVIPESDIEPCALWRPFSLGTNVTPYEPLSCFPIRDKLIDKMMKDLSFEISTPVSFRFSMQGRIEGFLFYRDSFDISFRPWSSPWLRKTKSIR